MKSIQKKQRSETFWQQTIVAPLRTFSSSIKKQPLSFSGMFIVYGFVLSLLILSSFALLSGVFFQLNTYQDVLLNDVKPSYQATGVLSPQHMQQLIAFYALLKSVASKIILVSVLFIFLYAALRSLKDLLLVKWFLKKRKNFSWFWKQTLLTFGVFFLSLILLTVSIINFSPFTTLFLFLLLIFLSEFIPLCGVYLLSRKIWSWKFCLQLFVAFLISAVFLFIIALVLWWLLIFIFTLVSSLAVILGFLFLFIVFGKRRLFLLTFIFNGVDA